MYTCQSTYLPNNLSIYLLIYHPTYQPTCNILATCQPTNLPANQPTYLPACQPTNLPTYLATYGLTCQHTCLLTYLPNVTYIRGRLYTFSALRISAYSRLGIYSNKYGIRHWLVVYLTLRINIRKGQVTLYH